MLHNRIKIPIIWATAFAAFVCYCIALSATGTNINQLKASAFMTLANGDYEAYYGLISFGVSVTAGGQTYTSTEKWTSACSNDDICNDCIEANDTTIALISISLCSLLVSVMVNVVQLFRSIATLSYIAAAFSFVAWVLTLAAFSNYQQNCFHQIENLSTTNGLDHGNGFNATVAAFVFMFIGFCFNLVPGYSDDESNLMKPIHGIPAV